MIWRYYVKPAGFQEYLATHVKTKYPFLDTGTVQYRLFEINMSGETAISRGNLLFDESRYEDALKSYATALEEAEGKNNDEYRAIAMYGLARANAQLCRVAAAEKWFRDSIVLREAMPNQGGDPVIQNYSEFARFLLSRGRPADAVGILWPRRSEAGKNGF